jgi:hypothetical protein
MPVGALIVANLECGMSEIAYAYLAIALDACVLSYGSGNTHSKVSEQMAANRNDW